MKRKFTTFVLVGILGLAVGPLALEHLGKVQDLAENWTSSSFPSGLLTAHASEKAAATEEGPHSLAPANQTGSSEEFRWSGQVNPGRTIEIKGINGSVHAEPSSGSEVEVTATKKGRRSDPKEVEIRVVEHADGVTICSVYPSADLSRPNQCGPGDEGHSSVNNNDVEVDFKVRVPQGVRFSGRTVNGGIETGVLGGDVDAKTVNGSITIKAIGHAQAKTVNGSINASLGRTDWTGPLEFKTVNGALTLNLPAGTSAEVKAATMNGDISSDFPLSITGNTNRKQLRGTIGSGGRELNLKTVNGSIRLRRTS